jgi:hypothetical protein
MGASLTTVSNTLEQQYERLHAAHGRGYLVSERSCFVCQQRRVAQRPLCASRWLNVLRRHVLVVSVAPTKHARPPNQPHVQTASQVIALQPQCKLSPCHIAVLWLLDRCARTKLTATESMRVISVPRVCNGTHA